MMNLFGCIIILFIFSNHPQILYNLPSFNHLSLLRFFEGTFLLFT